MNKLEGLFTTRSPLSHIGENISIGSYLVQEPIIQPDNSVIEVFVYSGNAWRGQLRDCAAAYLLKRMNEKVKLDAYHLLFSGGKIGGDQSINIGQIQALRQNIPMIGLFGGGINNSLMPGLMRVGNCYPLCEEAKPALPKLWHDRCTGSYSDYTFEKELTRMDDSKNADLMEFSSEERTTEKKKGEASTQMRFSGELLATGVQLRTYIHLLNDAEMYLGVLLSALSEFADSPFIGGQGTRGHGLVDLDYQLNGEAFCWIDESGLRLTDRASEILEAYNTHIDQHHDKAVELLAA